MSGKLGTFLKILLSLLFLGLLAYLIDVRNVARRILSFPRPRYLLGAIFVQTIVLVFLGYSWQVLFRWKTKFPLPRAIGGNMMVNLVGNFLPGRFSARIMAPAIFGGLSKDLTMNVAVVCTYVHTTLYLLAYGLAALIGSLLLVLSSDQRLVLVLLVPVMLYLLFGSLLVVLPYLSKKRVSRSVLNWLSLEEWLKDIRRNEQSFGDLLGSPTRIVGSFAASFGALSLLSGLRIYLLFEGMGIDVSPIWIAFVLPALYSVTILPFTVGGIGLAEGSAIGIMSLFGHSPETLAVIFLLDRVLAMYLPSLLGAIFVALVPGNPLSLADDSDLPPV